MSRRGGFLAAHRTHKETTMKTTVLCGIAFVCSSTAFAQTSAASVTEAPKTITLTGCVGGGTNDQPITLANAMVIPSSEQAGVPIPAPSPVPNPVSDPATQPPTTVGTSGTAGTSGAITTSDGIGTSGTITGTAPAGSSTSSISGYRLSGTDMTSWLGRRVQIAGTVVPAAGDASTLTPGAARIGPDGSPVMPEFRVVSVQPITGSCGPEK
jgi:hypothetical protein